MKQLYTANNNVLGNFPNRDAKLWHDIYKVIGLNVSLIDRTNTIKMPFNFKIYDEFLMPGLNQHFKITYEECCNNRAIELLNLARLFKKPIIVLYSGGIDSTLMLISMMKNCPLPELKDLIKVALSTESIIENPNFYYDYIRENFTLVSSDNIDRYFDNSSIIVGGEFNDQLFGTDIPGIMYKDLMYYRQLNNRYSRKFIVDWFILKGMSVESSNHWFDLLDNHIKKTDGCQNITTNFHFFWWINFCFKWQSIFFRLLARIVTNRKHITKDFVGRYFHHYYSTNDFQLWSRFNHDKKIIGNWTTYKSESKNIIYEFNHDSNYRDYKIKIPSLSVLFQQRKTADAIDSEFNFIDEYKLVASNYYNSDNSFA
jgi:hypothetical protein